MRYDFNFYNPTKIYFGKDSLSHLEDELAHYGKNVLFVYGGGSIKKIGLYDQVMEILKKAKKSVVELSGVMPNPTYKKMMEGASLVEQHHIDFILAVGGGSVIDCAKGISVAAYQENPWKKYWIDNEEVKHTTVPVGSILTMVGTGSEMNGGSVITNEEEKLKKGRVFDQNVYPKFSILNPTYTFTVSKYQMLSGIFDIFSHLMEQYFSNDDDNVSDDLMEALMHSLIKNTYKAVENPLDYEVRSNIEWISTLALNGLTKVGKTQDWQVHSIEHQLGAYTDCAHGMGLAAISTPYYRFIMQYAPYKFAKFAKEVFRIPSENKDEQTLAKLGIDALANFIKEVGMCTTLKELGATKEMLPLIANSTDLGGGYHDLAREEVLQILEACYE